MTQQSKTTLQSYFQTGDRPTQAQFTDLIDSFQSFITVNLEDYGAVGDGVTDDTDAFEDALATGNYVEGEAGKTYLVSSTIAITNGHLRFNGNGCKIQLSGNIGLFNSKVSFTNTTTISSIDNAATADLSGGTVGTNSDVANLTVASVSGYSVGDVVKIFSDDSITGEDPAENRKIAEYGCIAEINGSVITLYSRLRNTYTTSPRLAKLSQNYGCDLRNFHVLGQVNPTASWSTPAIQLTGWANPYLENIKFTNLVERATRFLSCYRTVTVNLDGADIRTSEANDAFGYLIQEAGGCFQGRHFYPKGKNVRHVYSCSATGADALDSLVENYGGNYESIIVGGHGTNCQAAAFDTHADGEDITFIGCTEENPYWGSIGNFSGFGFRGRRNKAVGCVAIGGTGFRAFSDYASTDNSRDHEFNDCTYYFNPGITQDTRGFDVLGISGGEVTGVRVTNPKIVQDSGDEPSFECTYGEMLVTNPYIRAKQSGTSTGRIFEANTSGTIRVKNGRLDYTGALGTGLRTARITNATGAVYIDGLEIVAAAGFSVIGDLTSTNATLIAKNIDTTIAPSFNTSGLTGLGASAVAWTDFRVDDARTSTQAEIASVTVSGAGSLTISIGNRYAPIIYARYLTNSAGGEIDNISAGAFIGQQLIINNRVTSTNTIQITTGANRVSIGTNETIAIGRSFRLRWDGTNWVSS